MARTNHRGFTIIELSLAIIFVSILALAIMTVAIQMTHIYSKGVTLRSTNEVARAISDQLTLDLHAAPSSMIQAGQVSNGRLCVGSATYLWNTPATLSGQAGSPSEITEPDGTPVYLVRVTDPTQQFCNTGTTLTAIPAGLPLTELISSSTNLAIYTVQFSQFVQNQPIYEINYTLGTNDASEIAQNGTVTQCKPPTTNGANFDFCSVNQFDLVIKASTSGGN